MDTLSVLIDRIVIERHSPRSPNLEMESEISREMQDGIRKWQIVNPDDPDQDNGTKLLNYCIVIGPGQVYKISN
ncbi:hypothetical protein TNCV_2776791 [Trichonephila clavipes]|nr:hypothetical protein TNCV_2776791 [Trichonephila clavipes]